MTYRISAGGIVIKDNKIILIKQHQIMWSFPKGKVEENESKLETAKREIFEETGITDFKFVKELGKYERSFINPDGTLDPNQIVQINMFLFKTKQNDLNSNDKSTNDPTWFSIDEALTKLGRSEDIKFLRKIKAELL